MLGVLALDFVARLVEPSHRGMRNGRDSCKPLCNMLVEALGVLAGRVKWNDEKNAELLGTLALEDGRIRYGSVELAVDVSQFAFGPPGGSRIHMLGLDEELVVAAEDVKVATTVACLLFGAFLGLPLFEGDTAGLPSGGGKEADTGALSIPPCLVVVLHGAVVGELNVEPALQNGFKCG